MTSWNVTPRELPQGARGEVPPEGAAEGGAPDGAMEEGWVADCCSTLRRTKHFLFETFWDRGISWLEHGRSKILWLGNTKTKNLSIGK